MNCTCTCACTHTYTHIYTHTYTHTHIHTHIYTHTYTPTHTHTYTYTYIHTYIHTCRHAHTLMPAHEPKIPHHPPCRFLPSINLYSLLFNSAVGISVPESHKTTTWLMFSFFGGTPEQSYLPTYSLRPSELPADTPRDFLESRFSECPSRPGDCGAVFLPSNTYLLTTSFLIVPHATTDTHNISGSQGKDSPEILKWT